jgi:hypothetical protein
MNPERIASLNEAWTLLNDEEHARLTKIAVEAGEASEKAGFPTTSDLPETEAIYNAARARAGLPPLPAP